jgi:hypothetical protein
MKEQLKKFWNFLKEDSWPSFFVGLIIALIVIKFIIFPTLTFFTGTALPLVIVESCSMYHSTSMENILQSNLYTERGIYLNETKNWPLKNGFSKGDIIFVLSAKNLKVGDVAIFSHGTGTPIIHRVIEVNDETFTTKGDNNWGLLPYEQNTPKENAIGKAVFRIPALGWVKLIFFDWRNQPAQRGFC